MYKCPICYKDYNESSFTLCTCGFNDYHFYDNHEQLLFKIFKYTKNVFLNKIDYPYSQISITYKDNHLTYIDFTHTPKGLAYIYAPYQGYVVNQGICALSQTKALIIDCEYIDGNFLDESIVEILFLGKTFKGFINEVKYLNKIKYLYIDKDNPYYKVINNQLIKK